jgi:fucose permease
LNNATNAFVSDLHPEDRTVALNRLGMFFCIGAIFVPLLMGSLLAVLGIRKIILAATAVVLLPALLFWMPAFPEAKQREPVFLRSVLEALAHPFVLLMGILFFFESGGEFSSGGWITSFFISERGLSNRQASWILAMLWLAVMLGRLSVGIWLKKIPEIRFVFLSAFGGALCWLLLLCSRVLALQVLAVPLLGFCLAGIFPTCLSIAGARFPKDSGAVFGALFAIGTLGGMSVPYAVGELAAHKGIASGMAILPFCSAAVAILSRHVARSRQ